MFTTIEGTMCPKFDEIKRAIAFHFKRAETSHTWWHKDKEALSDVRKRSEPDQYYFICRMVYQFPPVKRESSSEASDGCRLRHQKQVEIAIDPLNHRFNLYLFHDCVKLWDRDEKIVDEFEHIVLLDKNLRRDAAIRLAYKYHKCLVANDEENLRYKAFKSE